MTQPMPNERENVSNLQRYLRQLSFDFPMIPPPPIDGLFESITEEALRSYQELRGLPVTGRADLKTWNTLFQDYRSSIERNTRGQGFRIFPRTPVDYSVSSDEEHFLVEVIQYILNELRVLYDDIPQNGQSGVFDATTRQGVLAFQRRHGIPLSGDVDKITWNALVDAHQRLTDQREQ